MTWHFWLAAALAWTIVSGFVGCLIGTIINRMGRDDDATYGASEGRWPE